METDQTNAQHLHQEIDMYILKYTVADIYNGLLSICIIQYLCNLVRIINV